MINDTCGYFLWICSWSRSVLCEKRRSASSSYVKEKISLVYGGGRVGLMGELADKSIKSAIHVIGVMPKALVNHELAHQGIDELIVVNTISA